MVSKGNLDMASMGRWAAAAKLALALVGGSGLLMAASSAQAYPAAYFTTFSTRIPPPG